MFYGKYTVIKRAFIGGKLYHLGDVVDHQDGFETRRSLRGIGDPICSNENVSATEETFENHQELVAEDEIKRNAPGKWKLPNGDIFTGKLIEAKEHWNKIKNN